MLWVMVGVECSSMVTDMNSKNTNMTVSQVCVQSCADSGLTCNDVSRRVTLNVDKKQTNNWNTLSQTDLDLNEPAFWAVHSTYAPYCTVHPSFSGLLPRGILQFPLSTILTHSLHPPFSCWNWLARHMLPHMQLPIFMLSLPLALQRLPIYLVLHHSSFCPSLPSSLTHLLPLCMQLVCSVLGISCVRLGCNTATGSVVAVQRLTSTINYTDSDMARNVHEHRSLLSRKNFRRYIRILFWFKRTTILIAIYYHTLVLHQYKTQSIKAKDLRSAIHKARAGTICFIWSDVQLRHQSSVTFHCA